MSRYKKALLILDNLENLKILPGNILQVTLPDGKSSYFKLQPYEVYYFHPAYTLGKDRAVFEATCPICKDIVIIEIEFEHIPGSELSHRARVLAPKEKVYRETCDHLITDHIPNTYCQLDENLMISVFMKETPLIVFGRPMRGHEN